MGILNDIGPDLKPIDDPLFIDLADFNANAIGKKVLLD
jgi:hypothetical protein